MSERSPVVLVVEDEKQIRQFVRAALEQEGCRVYEAGTSAQGLIEAGQQKPDLLVLDLGLPDGNGIDFISALRGWSDAPILVLSARTHERDKVLALDVGADDYLTKPFSPRELVARVKAVLRRSQKETTQPGELSVGRLRFNFSRYEVHMGGAKLELTPKEYELLKMLATNLGKVFTREQLLEKVWGYEYFGDTRTVDVHVRHLRAKMSSDPETAETIETVRGFGYRLRELE